jgi:beta-galactosidase
VNCRGPHENYIDRQDGALVRLYSAAISTLHTPYIAPSENGGRGGVRWMALMPEQTAFLGGCPIVVATAQPVDSSEQCQPWPQDNACTVQAAGKDLVFCPRDCFHFSASHYSTEDLHTAKHDHELPTDGLCCLHLDGMHMGVGGDDSWTPSVRSVPNLKYLTERAQNLQRGSSRAALSVLPCETMPWLARRK